MRRALVEQLETCRSVGQTPVLSGEFLSSMASQDFRALCDFFAANGFAVCAVGYVRPPKSFMESAFQERLKNGGAFFDARRLYPHYRRRFAKFEMALERGRVHFWPFDPGAFPNGCVVRDFCRRLDIPIRTETICRLNESPSLPPISLLYAYRRFGPGYGSGPTAMRENRLLNAALSDLAGPRLRFHASLVAPVLAEQSADIAWMEERLGVALKEDLNRDDAQAIRSEEDLLRFPPQALEWLAGRLGPWYARRWRPDMAAQEVAEWMHALRLVLGRENFCASGAGMTASPRDSRPEEPA